MSQSDNVFSIHDAKVFAVEADDFRRTPCVVAHGFRTGREGAVVNNVLAPTRQEYLQPGFGFGTDEAR